MCEFLSVSELAIWIRLGEERCPMEVSSLAGSYVDARDVLLVAHPDDNVGLAKGDLEAGVTLRLERSGSPPDLLVMRESVSSGHKVALEEIPSGASVRRYGYQIGVAKEKIPPGMHVHVHNVREPELARDLAVRAGAERGDPLPSKDKLEFDGYRRPDGRVGTRNYVAVIGASYCAAHTCREITRAFSKEDLAAFPNVDGVIALTHTSGCGGIRVGSPDYSLLQRTLGGVARHPNVGAFILVGLGCEVNQVSDLVRNRGLGTQMMAGFEYQTPRFVIQEVGGIRKTVQAGIAAIRELLPHVDGSRRSRQPVSALTVALQCGGSDAWSGVTANPLVGMVSDHIVRKGGTAVLGEVSDIYGAEHVLLSRCTTASVGERLVSRLRWWEEYVQRTGAVFQSNPSPGNIAGGITTVQEKALGAVAKGGSTPLVDVCEYADLVKARGLVFMDTPGYDQMSVTGQVAGGCNLVLLTTGRGSVMGFSMAPLIRIASNSVTFRRMTDDMDFDAGTVLTGESMEEVAARLMELVLAVASGQATKSELEGVGEVEFSPWQTGERL
jgi:altronate hydrolase